MFELVEPKILSTMILLLQKYSYLVYI